MLLIERWQLCAWLIFVCLRGPKCLGYLCMPLLLKMCSSHQSVATFRFTHRLQWVTNYVFTTSKSPWPQANTMANLPAASAEPLQKGQTVIFRHWSWQIFCECCSFIKLQQQQQHVRQRRASAAAKGSVRDSLSNSPKLQSIQVAQQGVTEKYSERESYRELSHEWVKYFH